MLLPPNNLHSLNKKGKEEMKNAKSLEVLVMLMKFSHPFVVLVSLVISALPVVSLGGTLFLGGGGNPRNVSDPFIAAFANKAAGRHLILLPLADKSDDEESEEDWVKLGFNKITYIWTDDREEADDENSKLVRTLRDAASNPSNYALFIPGGDEERITDVMGRVGRETKALEYLVAYCKDDNGIYGGTSAGTLVMGKNARHTHEMNGIKHRGFGLMPDNVALDVHFHARERNEDEKVTAVLNDGVEILIGIDEDGGLIFDTKTGNFAVIGTGNEDRENNKNGAQVMFATREEQNGWSNNGDFHYIELSDGDTISLETLASSGIDAAAAVSAGGFSKGFARASSKTRYQPTWESLREYKYVPKWLRDGKFGIYTHWGPYAVHAFGENTTWYSHALYSDEREQRTRVSREHFEDKFGKLTRTYGYKDLIPLFKAEKFDADEWAEVFQKAGARFAGPVAEHHDGFAMWDTKYSEWNAAKMGPKRDVVGELEEAIKDRGMKYVTAFHHAANWFFFPVWSDEHDVGDPKYEGLYGQQHEEGDKRNQEFLDEWYGKIIEVIDNYSPDFIWFDFALDDIPEGYVKDFLAYYYNHAEANGKEVVVTYKGHDLVPQTGVRDFELGQETNLTYYEWITDSTVDDRGAWGYADDLVFKSPNRLIDNLVDRVSKNGYLLLNVGPKADGTIPEKAKEVLLAMGAWLKVNGEAIYGTSPWMIAAEGPTNLGDEGDSFNESDVVYTGRDIRFTVKGDNLYATFLAWPGDYAVIKTLRARANGQAMESIIEKDLDIDGETLHSGSNGPYYEGFYTEEIKEVTLLGHDKPLKWARTEKGLEVEMPDEKPCEHAFVIKIERHHHPKLK